MILLLLVLIRCLPPHAFFQSESLLCYRSNQKSSSSFCFHHGFTGKHGVKGETGENGQPNIKQLEKLESAKM